MKHVTLCLVGAMLLVGQIGLVGQSSAQAGGSGSASGRFIDSLPNGRTLPVDIADGARTVAIAISPDGRNIIYRAQENGVFRLYRREISQFQATPIGDRGAAYPFFSPDGQSIGFTAPSPSEGFAVGATLKRINLTGGSAQTMAKDIGSGAGVHWTADALIVGGAATAGLRRLPLSGGDLSVLAKPAADTSFRFPQLLSDGKTILYTGGTGVNGQVMLLDVASGVSKTLLPGLNARYLSSGHIVFAAKSNARSEDYSLWAVAFDPASGQTRGAPVPVIDGVRVDPSGIVHAAVSDTGALAYLPGTTTAQRAVFWINRQGQEQRLDIEPRTWATPRISPDGTRLVLSTRDAGLDIYVYNLSGRQLTQLTTDTTPNYLPAWSLDGTRVLFTALVPFEGSTTSRASWRAADGSGEVQPYGDPHPGGDFPQALLRDGRLLVAIATTDVAVLPAGGKGPRDVLLNAPEVERNAVVSPDGRWVAYESRRTGRPEINVRPFPNVKEREYTVTKEGGCCPVWAHDGQLYYWTGSSGQTVSIMAVPTTTADTVFSTGAPKTVAAGSFAKPSWDTPYDVATDGRIFVTKAISPPPNQIVTIANFMNEVRRLVPVK